MLVSGVSSSLSFPLGIACAVLVNAPPNPGEFTGIIICILAPESILAILPVIVLPTILKLFIHEELPEIILQVGDPEIVN